MAEPPKHRIGFADSLKFTTSLCLTYTLGVALLRVWVRRGIFGTDDIVICVATVVCLGHFASNYLALAYGAGKPWSLIQQGGNIESLNSASIASIVTFVVSLYVSKCAVVSFLARLTKNKQSLLVYWVCIALISALGIVSMLVVTVGWPLKSGYYWAFYLNQQPCDSQMTRWYVFTALDIFTEILLLVLPAQLVWGLQMPLKKKASVIAAFYLRLPVIGISIGRLIYTQHLCGRDVDVGLESTLVLIWLEVETSYAIVSSTFSALKAFTTNFNSSFGLGFVVNAGEGDYYGLSHISRNDGGSAAKSRPAISRKTTAETALKRGITVQDREVSEDTPIGSPIKLQPTSARSYAHISSQPVITPHAERRWREGGSSDIERTLEDGVTVQTEYTVQHHDTNDELPILSRPNTPGMYTRR